MKSCYFTILLFIIFGLIGCKKDKSQGRSIAKYKVTITFNWNNTDFPTDYPSNPHFSRLIAWNHKPNDTLLTTETFSTSGIEAMAELGRTTPLDSEIINLGYNPIIGESLSAGTGEITINMDITINKPCITLTTMIAPSPDWFVAVTNVNLFENGQFVKNKIVTAQVYDAGTDNGITFTSTDEDTNPKEVITKIITPPLGNGTTINPDIGIVKFEKQ